MMKTYNVIDLLLVKKQYFYLKTNQEVKLMKHLSLYKDIQVKQIKN